MNIYALGLVLFFTVSTSHASEFSDISKIIEEDLGLNSSSRENLSSIAPQEAQNFEHYPGARLSSNTSSSVMLASNPVTHIVHTFHGKIPKGLSIYPLPENGSRDITGFLKYKANHRDETGTFLLNLHSHTKSNTVLGKVIPIAHLAKPREVFSFSTSYVEVAIDPITFDLSCSLAAPIHFEIQSGYPDIKPTYMQ